MTLLVSDMAQIGVKLLFILAWFIRVSLVGSSKIFSSSGVGYTVRTPLTLVMDPNMTYLTPVVGTTKG